MSQENIKQKMEPERTKTENELPHEHCTFPGEIRPLLQPSLSIPATVELATRRGQDCLSAEASPLSQCSQGVGLPSAPHTCARCLPRLDCRVAVYQRGTSQCVHSFPDKSRFKQSVPLGGQLSPGMGQSSRPLAAWPGLPPSPPLCAHTHSCITGQHAPPSLPCHTPSPDMPGGSCWEGNLSFQRQLLSR